MLGSLIIIPNENKLHIDPYPYISNLNPREKHVPKIKEFSNMYNLGITCEMLGVEEDDITGTEWHKKIASLGHAVVITRGDVVIIYLPKRISTKQNEWFLLNYSLFVNKHLWEFMQIDENMKVIKEGHSYNNPLILENMCGVIKNSLEKVESSDLKR